MENDFKFGDMIYHKGKKCVYMGKLPSQTDFREVLFENTVMTTSVPLDELSRELPPIKFVHEKTNTVYSFGTYDPKEKYLYFEEKGGEAVYFYVEDVDKFIDCLNQVKERYGND